MKERLRDRKEEQNNHWEVDRFSHSISFIDCLLPVQLFITPVTTLHCLLLVSIYSIGLISSLKTQSSAPTTPIPLPSASFTPNLPTPDGYPETHTPSSSSKILTQTQGPEVQKITLSCNRKIFRDAKTCMCCVNQ